MVSFGKVGLELRTVSPDIKFHRWWRITELQRTAYRRSLPFYGSSGKVWFTDICCRNHGEEEISQKVASLARFGFDMIKLWEWSLEIEGISISIYLPEVTTSSIGFCNCSAIDPMTLNITKPANILVPQLINDTVTASLKRKWNVAESSRFSQPLKSLYFNNHYDYIKWDIVSEIRKKDTILWDSEFHFHKQPVLFKSLCFFLNMTLIAPQDEHHENHSQSRYLHDI